MSASVFMQRLGQLAFPPKSPLPLFAKEGYFRVNDGDDTKLLFGTKGTSYSPLSFSNEQNAFTKA
jgi:hypothetical protein